MTHEDMIREGLRLLAKAAYDNSVAHGFHEDRVQDKLELLMGSAPSVVEALEENDGRMFMVRLMLVVTELAEAAEAYRDHGLDPDKLFYLDEKGKPEGIAAELADVVIRVGDLCGSLGIDLGKAVELKMAYNKTRPPMHGGKKL